MTTKNLAAELGDVVRRMAGDHWIGPYLFRQVDIGEFVGHQDRLAIKDPQGRLWLLDGSGDVA